MADAEDEKIDATRRRLLRIAAYTPPAILGAVVINQLAGCQAVSCSPQVCTPNQCAPDTCTPTVNPCSPDQCNPAACNPNG